jgi:membrane protein DedA with SNARE-associated domain
MSQQKPPKKKYNKTINTAARLSGSAIQMGATIYLGNLLGSWVENKYGFSFAEELITFVAVIMAMYILIKQAIQLNK